MQGIRNMLMIKSIINRDSRSGLLLMFCLVVLSAFQSTIKQNGNIILHDELLPVTPKEFYIAQVMDERADRSAIAWLLPAANSKDEPKTYAVDLQGGGFAAIKQYINNALRQNENLRPIVISLKKCTITEIAQTGGLVEGRVTVRMSFSLQQDDEMQHLVDYDGTAKYTRYAGPPQDIEPTLRRTLGNGLLFFDNWINRQAGINILLAKSVAVAFTDYSEKPEGDTIYYSVNRPITWADFKGGVPQSSFAAEVSPTIGYDERTQVSNGVINLKLDIKVCLPKSACWAKDGIRDDYTLNHEQRHFDIAKIVAEHFKLKIKAENLPVTNYDGPINVDYLDAYREMDSLQKKYDDETGHGVDHYAQQRWNLRVDDELKKFGVLR